MRYSSAASKHRTGNAGLPTQVYNAWLNLRKRCRNKNTPQYHDYGGRGIDYDPRWDDFEVFLGDVGEPPRTELTLDRIDNDRGYWPGNVRWADRVTQRRNSRAIRLVSFGGRTMCVEDWARHLGVTQPTMHERLAKWPVRMACTRAKVITGKLTPVLARRIYVDKRPQRIVARAFDVSVQTVWAIKTGRLWAAETMDLRNG